MGVLEDKNQYKRRVIDDTIETRSEERRVGKEC